MLEKSIKGLVELREAQGDIEVRRWKTDTSEFESREEEKTSRVSMETQRGNVRSAAWKEETKDGRHKCHTQWQQLQHSSASQLLS